MQMNSTSAPDPPFVSVIIPVYNDTERLKNCLGALEYQTYPRTMYEVVVVDNGSQEDIRSVVDPFQQAVLYTERQTGSYAARNKGISVSRGDILAFTDSDCIPATDWIEKGVAHIKNAQTCGLIAGRVNLFYRNPKRLSAVELYEKMFAFNQQDNINTKHFGVTANVFTRKSVFDQVGLFNAVQKSGGDLEWGNRVFDAGLVQIYADDVCVEHPARHSLKQLYKKRVRVLGGLSEMNKGFSYSPYEAVTDLKNIFVYTFWLMRCFLSNRPPSDKFENTRQKLLYLFIIPYVRVISVFEKLRLQNGGMTQR